jgi:glycosyltransferase involved in cell wall biosynthesis
MIRLAREWAKLGHEVTCFCPTSAPERHYEYADTSYGDGFPGTALGFHEYVEHGAALTCLRNFQYDAMISWEFLPVLGDSQVMELQPFVAVEMQVAHFEPAFADMLVLADAIFVLSDWHREFAMHEQPDLDPDKIRVLKNCVDLERYPWSEDDAEERRLANSFFYSSSPDRGLVHILRLWPELRQRLPGATLTVAYGVERWVGGARWQHQKLGEMAVEIEALMKQDGIFDVGSVGQAQLAKIQTSSTAMLYPCDTIQSTETGCITAVEAGAAGAPMFLAACDCLPSEFGDVAKFVDLPFDADEYLDQLTSVLADPDEYAKMRDDGRRMAEGRTWDKAAKLWLGEITSLSRA